MQTEGLWVVNASDFPIYKMRLHDPDLAGDSFSVRGYGWRTYEPRQGRNAATVV
jgi:hypothetical protein